MNPGNKMKRSGSQIMEDQSLQSRAKSEIQRASLKIKNELASFEISLADGKSKSFP